MVCALDYLGRSLVCSVRPAERRRLGLRAQQKEGILQAIRETMCVCDGDGVDAVVVKSEERRWCVLEKTCVRVVVVWKWCD